MRRVWDACEGKAEETFATNLRKAAEAAALRAKEDPEGVRRCAWKSSSALGYPDEVLRGPDAIEIRDARRHRTAAIDKRRKAPEI